MQNVVCLLFLTRVEADIKGCKCLVNKNTFANTNLHYNISLLFKTFVFVSKIFPQD